MLNAKKHQRGMSLYIVIVIVLLSMLLALFASKTSVFNEIIVGNDADYQRAYEAAHAMIQDAEIDIKNASNRECIDNEEKVCRSKTGAIDIITETSSVYSFVEKVSQYSQKCMNGLCSKRDGVQDFWRNPEQLAEMTSGSSSDNTNIGARHGQYTGAVVKNDSNQILKETASGKGAWYWIEPMRFKEDFSANLTRETGREIKAHMLYRITAIARGIKPSTIVVIQSIVAPTSDSGE